MHENGIKSGSSRERENSNIGETGSIDQSNEAVLSYSRLPITRTFKGNRKKGSSYREFEENSRE